MVEVEAVRQAIKLTTGQKCFKALLYKHLSDILRKSVFWRTDRLKVLIHGVS
jgi:hypothetical protein